MFADTNIFEIFPIVLFFISFYGITTTGNIIKSIVFIMLMQASVIMFWLWVGSRSGVIPPITGGSEYFLENPEAISDPLPQALMLTAIIIGIAVTAINITMLNALFRKYKTVDWNTMQNLDSANSSKLE